MYINTLDTRVLYSLHIHKQISEYRTSTTTYTHMYNYKLL